MGMSDLESLIGASRIAIVVIYNDTAYGAEIHQYGSQGLTERPMLIPEVEFSGVARALGAESAVIRSLSDLSALQDWIDAGAHGTFVADCRITSTVRAPWLTEWIKASQGRERGLRDSFDLNDVQVWPKAIPRFRAVWRELDSPGWRRSSNTSLISRPGHCRVRPKLRHLLRCPFQQPYRHRMQGLPPNVAGGQGSL